MAIICPLFSMMANARYTGNKYHANGDPYMCQGIRIVTRAAWHRRISHVHFFQNPDNRLNQFRIAGCGILCASVHKRKCAFRNSCGNRLNRLKELICNLLIHMAEFECCLTFSGNDIFRTRQHRNLSHRKNKRIRQFPCLLLCRYDQFTHSNKGIPPVSHHCCTGMIA